MKDKHIFWGVVVLLAVAMAVVWIWQQFLQQPLYIQAVVVLALVALLIIGVMSLWSTLSQ